MTLSELKALREKAVQGGLRNEFAGMEGFVEYDLRTKQDGYVGTVPDYWTSVFLTMLWNWFDTEAERVFEDAERWREHNARQLEAIAGLPRKEQGHG